MCHFKKKVWILTDFGLTSCEENHTRDSVILGDMLEISCSPRRAAGGAIKSIDRNNNHRMLLEVGGEYLEFDEDIVEMCNVSAPLRRIIDCESVQLQFHAQSMLAVIGVLFSSSKP